MLIAVLPPKKLSKSTREMIGLEAMTPTKGAEPSPDWLFVSTANSNLKSPPSMVKTRA